MKKFLFLIAAMMLVIASCSRGGEYVSDGKYVLFKYWTFSFGTCYDTLPGADAATFKSVNEWLGHDAKNAYFKSDLVEGVDVATLKAEKYPLFRDKNDYFYKTKPMRVVDKSTFKVVKWIDDSFWAKDSKCAYFDTTHIAGVDIATFKVKDPCFAVDKNHVFRFGDILPLADPKTYEENWKGFYSRDKSHIWCMGELLEDVDYDSFVVDDDWSAHDKYGAFDHHRRVGQGENEPEPEPVPEQVSAVVE